MNMHSVKASFPEIRNITHEKKVDRMGIRALCKQIPMNTLGKGAPGHNTRNTDLQ